MCRLIFGNKDRLLAILNILKDVRGPVAYARGTFARTKET